MDSPWLIRVLLWPLCKPGDVLLSGDLDDTKFEKRVNTFYPPTMVASQVSLVAAVTVAFGAIHCIGWSFEFPSSIERTLWRVASLSITGVPIIILPLSVLGVAIDRFLLRSRFDDFCVFMMTMLPLFLYILSRLVLLALPFLCLRSLPPAAFHVVHWTSFIPHV